MANILRVDSDDDIILQYGVAFRNKFIFRNFRIEFPRHTLIESNGAQATSKNISDILARNSVSYISGLGHGLYDAFTGHQGQPIWGAAQSLGFLHGKVVHLLSCQTGALLGRMMVKQGVSAFWGYTVNFQFFRKNPPPVPFESDKTAEIFMKMDAIIDRGILAGKNSNEIYNSVDSYVAYVLPYLQPLHRAVILDNYVHLVCPSTTWGHTVTTI